MIVQGKNARPRILLLLDIPNWAFHSIAQAIVKELGDRFAFTILTQDRHPHIEESLYDLIHVFYEFEDYHRPFLTGKTKVLRSVYSHYWEIEKKLSPMQLYMQFLNDAHAISVPSIKLLGILKDLPPPVTLFSEGIDPEIFKKKRERSGPLTVGWAGKPGPIKRLELLQEACNGLCELKIANGSFPASAMADFYNDVDIIACSSIAEGCPRPLLEGMACGCFPVSFDVGIAPEVIMHQTNGLLVRDETTDGLLTALSWCKNNIGDMRKNARINPEIMRATRSWRSTTAPLADLYTSLLG
jgi:glycosyltransferase involved in cell wall biosynthesis